MRAYSLIQGSDSPLNEQFQKTGFLEGQIPQTIMEAFLHAFKNSKSIPFNESDYDPNYTYTGIALSTADSLNKYNTYFMFENEQLEAMKPILECLKEPISECFGTPWRVTSIRAWETPATGSMDNPTGGWHTDGYPDKSYKILLYARGASLLSGSTELQLPNGSTHVVVGEPGVWMIFKNSELKHRALSPQEGVRLLIEINVSPSITYDLEPICAGVNARHPILPWIYPLSQSYPSFINQGVIGVNIGGGPEWSSPLGWINFEEVTSPKNPHSFKLYPNCIFPLEDQSVKIIYSSHAFEHLDTPTLYRVLSESHRVLEKDGVLLIKVPDFDRALDCWLRRDPSFFGAEWAIESVTPLWAKMGICDCLDHRAAMIFCSYSNKAMGNLFSPAPCPDPTKAYFGPAIMSVKELRALIQNRTPSQITKELSRAILSKDPTAQLIHQNAWSREEFKELLQKFGFTLVTFDKEKILDTYYPIPGIREMYHQTMFCWARKN